MSSLARIKYEGTISKSIDSSKDDSPEAKEITNFLLTGLVGDALNMDGGRHREGYVSRVK